MNELALFAGAGGGILAGKLLGWNTIGAVEIEEYPREVLLQRQRDGILEKFPIWDDITTFDGKPWKGSVDIISGGFPCQDISAAGRGKGIEGERSGLWGEMARVVLEVSPRLVFVENSPMLTSRGLYRVLGDLAEMGYNARWCVLGADDVGAKHQRKRIWILGYSPMHGHTTTEKPDSINKGGDDSKKGQKQASQFTGSSATAINGNVGKYWEVDPAELPNSRKNNVQREFSESNDQKEREKQNKRQVRFCNRERCRPIESGLGGMVNGMASRMDRLKENGLGYIPRVEEDVNSRTGRLKAIGNGQVSLTAAVAFSILCEGLT